MQKFQMFPVSRLDRSINFLRGALRSLGALVLAFVFFVSAKAVAYECPQNPPPPKTETYQGFLGRVHVLNGEELPYRLFVPTDYEPTKSYPLVLYLHHAGLAGNDGNNETGWDNCVQLTSEIGSGDDYGGVFTHSAVDEDGTKFQTQERYPHFVLAPHAQASNYGFGGGVAGSATGPEHRTRPVLEDILKTVLAEFSIDPGRLYVTGVSMGCYGTWDIIMRKPGVFAAASPQSCRGDPNEELLAKIKDMPIWSMCGTNDSYFAGAQAMADGMKNVGATDATFTFTAMEGVGHSINDRGYDYPGFIDWMFAQRLPGTMPPGMGGAGGVGGVGGAGSSGSAGMTGGAAGSTVQAGQPTGGAGAGGASGSGGSSGAQDAGAPATAGAMSAVSNVPKSESSCSLAPSLMSRAPFSPVVTLTFIAAVLRRRRDRWVRVGRSWSTR
jgi:poly(3-hydroxybutyrate) depolymerase